MVRSWWAQGHGPWPVRKGIEQAVAEHRQASNPELLFFEEECEAQEGTEIICGDLYRRFVDWCEVGGHKAMDRGQFGKALSKRFPKVERVRRRREGKVPWVYAGVACSGCSYVPLLNVNSAGDIESE